MKIRFYTLTIDRELYFCSNDYVLPDLESIFSEAQKASRKYRSPVQLLVVYDNDKMSEYEVDWRKPKEVTP